MNVIASVCGGTVFWHTHLSFLCISKMCFEEGESIPGYIMYDVTWGMELSWWGLLLLLFFPLPVLSEGCFRVDVYVKPGVSQHFIFRPHIGEMLAVAGAGLPHEGAQ